MTDAANQYRLDFESAANNRHARLVSAVRLAGLDKLLPFARLVFNLQERSGGAPLRWTIERLAEEFGVSGRTVQRWQRTLAEAGLVTIAERRRARGGQQTNELAIAWDAVDARSLRRTETRVSPRGEEMSPRGEEMSPRGEEMSPPYKEYPSCIPSCIPSSSTSTTTKRDGAQTVVVEEEANWEAHEEHTIARMAGRCRERIPCCPVFLEDAIRRALAARVTLDELRARCAWFAGHWHEWPAEHREGVMHFGIAHARPGLPPDRGWPYGSSRRR